ncbi:DUF6934 family protein [Puia dinghuensis]|uniref:Uncharacterized protein n=1 Tax=Puia dinghuensis TaxID=1792502 RepID=A0A8J2XWY0_9BACT|nr:hypothetical protein [Puia dinghuensis]GGB23079.1 hypothetical protein GCM10011511_53770 [Puia dinghuensis]
MKTDQYLYYADLRFVDFEFESVGPKGSIRKIAGFTFIRPNLYSFGFGDLDEHTGDIIDTVTSNNGDGSKVLNTVAGIVHEFTLVFHEATIYIVGSTPSRTRWYQMNINAYWQEISILFEIYGYSNDGWEPFQKGVNYLAFMGRRRDNYVTDADPFQ